MCDTLARSSSYWDEILAPALRQGKTLLVVGHENNLRSLIMKLEGISKDDVIHLNIPRAVPLAYRLDENLQPMDRPDGRLDEATGFLRGEWLGGDRAVAEILQRDYKQVYETSITENLETGPDRAKWTSWMESIMGNPSPEAKAKSLDSQKDHHHQKERRRPLPPPPVAAVLATVQQQQQRSSSTQSHNTGHPPVNGNAMPSMIWSKNTSTDHLPKKQTSIAA